MRTKAFTLIELLVVVAIIGILAAVGVNTFNGFQEKARVAAMKHIHASTVKKITTELMKCQLGETTFFTTSKYGGSYSANCNGSGNIAEWRARSARNAAYISIAFKNPWHTKEFIIWEVTGRAGYFEKGKSIITSSGSTVSLRSCWGDCTDSSNTKLSTITTD